MWKHSSTPLESSGGNTSLSDTYGNWSYSATSFPFCKEAVFAEDYGFITTVETCLFVIVFWYFRGLVQPRTKENKEQKKKKPKTFVKSLQCSCSPSVMCRISVSPAVVQKCSWTHKSVRVFSTSRDKSPVRERKRTTCTHIHTQCIHRVSLRKQENYMTRKIGGMPDVGNYVKSQKNGSQD
jgi:hypothetical protein